MKLNVFGRSVEVVQRNNKWMVFYLGNEGKKRLADDIYIPDHVPHSEVVGYIADLCHEWATQAHPTVTIL